MTVISVDADGVLTQAVIRCLLAALLSRDEQQLPYINTPLHTVMRVHCVDSMPAHLEMIPLHVDCVDTHRHRPQVFFFCYDLGGGGADVDPIACDEMQLFPRLYHSGPDLLISLRAEQNVSVDRTLAEALVTVPAHYTHTSNLLAEAEKKPQTNVDSISF